MKFKFEETIFLLQGDKDAVVNKSSDLQQSVNELSELLNVDSSKMKIYKAQKKLLGRFASYILKSNTIQA